MGPIEIHGPALVVEVIDLVISSIEESAEETYRLEGITIVSNDSENPKCYTYLLFYEFEYVIYAWTIVLICKSGLSINCELCKARKDMMLILI